MSIDKERIKKIGRESGSSLEEGCGNTDFDRKTDLSLNDGNAL